MLLLLYNILIKHIKGGAALEINRVGKRGTLFTFQDLGIPTNVYVITGKKNIYVIDTYLGPDSMNEVFRHLGANKLPAFVINTHSHWDHVWGNCFFPADAIYAHSNCRKYMIEEGQEALEKYREYIRGNVKLVYPEKFIDNEFFLEEDNLLVYYTPGHSDDSLSVYDAEDKVLFAGDNLERPIPYFSSKDLKRYTETLEEYKSRDAEYVIGGHTGIEDKSLITHSLNYVKKVLSREDIEIESEEFLQVHNTNLSFLRS